MYTHNLDPILFDFGFMALRWYSLAYIFGILIGWWLGKKIIIKKFQKADYKFYLKEFDNLISYLIISIIIISMIIKIFKTLNYFTKLNLNPIFYTVLLKIMRLGIRWSHSI